MISDNSQNVMIRDDLFYRRTDRQIINDAVSVRVEEFLKKAKQGYLTSGIEVSLAQVKEKLSQRGVMESDMEYHICDFSESLQLRHGTYVFEFSRAVFPRDIDGHIRLDIKGLANIGRLAYSVENIADLTMSIIEWIPEYEKILINAQIENQKNKLLCKLGMTFLKTIAEQIAKKGFKCGVYESYTKENTAMIDIDYGNGISCTYTVDLLSDFQEKLIDIV